MKRRWIKIKLRYWSTLGLTAISYYTLDQVGSNHCLYVVGSPSRFHYRKKQTNRAGSKVIYSVKKHVFVTCCTGRKIAGWCRCMRKAEGYGKSMFRILVFLRGPVAQVMVPRKFALSMSGCGCLRIRSPDLPGSCIPLHQPAVIHLCNITSDAPPST